MTTVLVVEDEADLRFLARMTLDRAGFDVIEAGTGADAVAVLESSDTADVDVVMLDLRIPPPDGWEVLAWIHETGLNTRMRVVIVSAFVDPGTAARAASMGCRYLAKPFRGDDLVALIRGDDLPGT